MHTPCKEKKPIEAGTEKKERQKDAQDSEHGTVMVTSSSSSSSSRPRLSSSEPGWPTLHSAKRVTTDVSVHYGESPVKRARFDRSPKDFEAN